MLWGEDDFMAVRIDINIASRHKNGHAQSFRSGNNAGIRLIRIRQVTFEMFVSHCHGINMLFSSVTPIAKPLHRFMEPLL